MARRKTHEEFVAQVYRLVDDEYTVASEYKGDNEYILIIHNKCNHNYKVKPSNFIQGTRCPECRGTKKKTTEKFKQEVYDLIKDEYTVLGDYQSNRTKIRIRHNICDYVYDVVPGNFLRGARCSKCMGVKKKNTEIFKQEVFNLVEDSYLVIGEYSNTISKIKMRHEECGFEFDVSPNKFLNGTRCPYCNASKGEFTIANWLKKNNIMHKPQYKFDDCKNILSLPFDFAVFDNKNKLKLLIEYDGEGHFEPFRFSKDKNKMLEKLRETQRNDSIKNRYCENNNIPLLRIPYWEFDNIEEILERELNTMNLLSNKKDSFNMTTNQIEEVII
ncbi:DUF2726 domain-containing protein [Metabacillus fastidiosus]|uniref:DUF2726 domain-containing protein n=1 Tax=Metabacillus fastidiosus TaxID=1458 RepID=UPI003D2B8915